MAAAAVSASPVVTISHKLQVGQEFPHGDVVILVPDTKSPAGFSRTFVDVHTLIDKKGITAFFFLPAANTYVCTNKHLPGFMNNPEFAKVRVIVITTDTINTLAKWTEKDKTICIASDVKRTLGTVTGLLKMQGADETLGGTEFSYYNRSSVILGPGGIVKFCNVEEPKSCAISNGETALKQIASLVEDEEVAKAGASQVPPVVATAK